MHNKSKKHSFSTFFGKWKTSVWRQTGEFNKHSGHHNYMLSEMIPLNSVGRVWLCACVILFLRYVGTCVLYVRGESWVVTCRRHDPSVHQTAVGQHVVSPALCHTLQPLGRSSRPRTVGRKHELTSVIRQFNTLLPPQSVSFSCWDWDGWPG